MPGSGAGEIVAHPSPNFGDRRDGLTPEYVVLHYTVLGLDEALERLSTPEHEVSAHYLIARDGRLFRLVDEDKRAWHAGAGSWQGRGDLNSRSIGVELENSGAAPFSARLMDRLEALLADLLARWHLPPERVIGHQDFAPRRKGDPGARFDWQRLARNGLAVWPEAVTEVPAPEEAAFLDLAARFGYPVEDGFEPVLGAFRARFRPWGRGPLAAGDMAAIADLARRFPVDRDGLTA